VPCLHFFVDEIDLGEDGGFGRRALMGAHGQGFGRLSALGVERSQKEGAVCVLLQ